MINSLRYSGPLISKHLTTILSLILFHILHTIVSFISLRMQFTTFVVQPLLTGPILYRCHSKCASISFHHTLTCLPLNDIFLSHPVHLRFNHLKPPAQFTKFFGQLWRHTLKSLSLTDSVYGVLNTRFTANVLRDIYRMGTPRKLSAKFLQSLARKRNGLLNVSTLWRAILGTAIHVHLFEMREYSRHIVTFYITCRVLFSALPINLWHKGEANFCLHTVVSDVHVIYRIPGQRR